MVVTQQPSEAFANGCDKGFQPLKGAEYGNSPCIGHKRTRESKTDGYY